MRQLTLFLPLALLAACAARTDAPYPALLPLDTLLTEAAPAPDPAPALEARAAALRARAAQLRQPLPDALPPR